MPRYKLSAEERAKEQRKRELALELFSLLPTQDIRDTGGVFRDLVGIILENGLEGELEDKLGYSRYDYRNKDTHNSRNGHSHKRLATSNGELEVVIHAVEFTKP